MLAVQSWGTVVLPHPKQKTFQLPAQGTGQTTRWLCWFLEPGSFNPRRRPHRKTFPDSLLQCLLLPLHLDRAQETRGEASLVTCQIFKPYTYLISMHICHVFEFWNPDSVFLWKASHSKNPQVSAFTGKKSIEK